ncbi:XRE family transcriptional regulator [Streptomyces sp. GbtcB6]|uniref:helix-turn-helix domain-containing protein n=1 Tax=Streptomyces sp. GbtcB6 TaxID=2824751 RepID=UPI001C30ACA9|nr:XRE family transcriptional regulator [Streptomyces sp. GbtcB6]
MTEGARPGPRREPRAVGAPEVRHLVERLREAREGTGLSFAALAARTAYSKSSWERYLNGKTLPPRDAVETLAKLSGADPVRLLALWQLADRAWSGRDARATDPAASDRAATAPGTADPAQVAPGTDASRETRAQAAVVDPPPGQTGEPAPTRSATVRRYPEGDGRPEPRDRKPRRGTVLLVAAGTALATALGVGAVAWTYGGWHREPASRPTSGTCRGENCTDRDAEQHDTDCWTDAGTRARREIAGRIVELRFSPTCRAAWGRITAPRSGDRLQVDTTDGRHQSRLVLVPGRYLYTLMIGLGRPSEARACIELPDGSSTCTGWGR